MGSFSQLVWWQMFVISDCHCHCSETLPENAYYYSDSAICNHLFPAKLTKAIVCESMEASQQGVSEKAGWWWVPCPRNWRQNWLLLHLWLCWLHEDCGGLGFEGARLEVKAKAKTLVSLSGLSALSYVCLWCLSLSQLFDYFLVVRLWLWHKLWSFISWCKLQGDVAD